MRWIIPKRRDQDISPRPQATNADFNAPLAENDGGVCVMTDHITKKVAEAGQNEADADIRSGRVKTFDNPDDLIASLKQPW